MNRQLFQYHPRIGYTFIPGLKTRVAHEAGGYLVQVNQAGFRSAREYVPERTPGSFRVLLFGDSFTAADGVSNKKRYSDLLEAQIDGLEIYNYGLSGTGTDQQMITHEEMAGGIEHDLVVIAVLVENIRRVAARYRVYQSAEGGRFVYAKPYFSLESDATLARHHDPVPREPIPEDDLPPEAKEHVDRGGNLAWVRTVVNRFGTRARDVAQRLSHWQPLPAYDSPDNPDWLLTRAILTQWIERCEAPVIVMPIPLYHYVEESSDPSSYRARFAELGEAAGATIHDPLDDYHRTPKSERRAFRFATDVHPTPASHQVLADSLAPRIRSLMDRRGN